MTGGSGRSHLVPYLPAVDRTARAAPTLTLWYATQPISQQRDS